MSPIAGNSRRITPQFRSEMRSSATRRQVLAAAGGALAAMATHAEEIFPVPKSQTATDPFGYCLNTSTIRGQNLPLAEEIDIAAKVGFGAIEPWIGEIEKHVQGGGSTSDLRKRLADRGLKVPSAIGFAEWIIDDDARRAKGLEHMKRDMDLVAQVGGTRIAAPAAGLGNGQPVPSLPKIAERYRGILDAGKQIGVTPEIELWGFAPILNRLGDVVYAAVESGDPNACVLLDVYHIYKGGSDIAGIKLLRGEALGVFHVNDYPATPTRDRISDEHRVYPGDGIAPLKELFHTLRDIGWRGYLSVELFNKTYWTQRPLKVAQPAFGKQQS